MRSQSGRLVAVLVGLVVPSAVAHAADPAAELATSMQKLAALKYYKVRNGVEIHYPPDVQRQVEAMKAAGLGDFAPKPTVQEFVNPDLRRSTTPQRMPAVSRVAGGPVTLEANLVTVIKAPTGGAPKVATYIDCQQCEKSQDQAINDLLKRQAAATAKGLVSEVVNGLVGGPLGIAGALISAAQVGAQASMTRGASEAMKENLSLNRWTCRDLGIEPAPAAKGDAADGPTFQGAEYRGEQQVGEEIARVYDVAVGDASKGKTSPMTIYVSTRTGLPLKTQMPMDMGQAMSGAMTSEYYDFDVPIQIEVPDCLK